MVPHTRCSGCVALLDPFSLRETPVELCAKGEIWGCAQPPKTSTFAYPQPLQQRIKYGATPTLVLSPSAKPDLENAQTMHHEIQEFSHSVKPPSRESADKARVKYGRVRSHPGPQPSCIPNPYNDESSTAPHPLRFFLPLRNPTRRMHRQCTTKHRSAQPPKTPTLEYPQPIRRRNKYGATHPLWRVCGTVLVSSSYGLWAILDFLTLQNPCPKNPRTRPRRNTGMRAATQDPNSRLFATNTMSDICPEVFKPMFNPSQGSRHSWCPGIFGLWLRMKMWMPLPLATLHKELEGPHPSKLQSFSGINTVIIVPWGPPRFFNPILYPAAFTPPRTETYWANIETLKKFFSSIIVTYLHRQMDLLGHPRTSTSIVILDAWLVHRGAELREWVQQEYPWIFLIYGYKKFQDPVLVKKAFELCVSKVMGSSDEARDVSMVDDGAQEAAAYDPEQDPGGLDGCDMSIETVRAEILNSHSVQQKPSTLQEEFDPQDDMDDPAIESDIIPTPP
ncbi:hypothetical protein BS47DRAFT_1366880 [Hydnum rufescens UP504]|uniref:DDE-1 domain-containing protein n=1 Tax=Hydnum rufescens UP504 TaxID=1448309 RepID=A0A9P6AJT9_9AGAM|nr:hypothetical protein BS47DRAFT_1366880 [Hydnum rufescens UP504]